ncbi:sigma-70 family RNA polymerase sigma factor [Tamlana sp. 2_MG-2023]|uniref:sigma-70 family RNA polymerase sigma factor n=1 Tax=unclassified Tamlana TaxID=2614803 RepID=UPI0026E2F881|nr:MULTISPECIES: sigma-70 family RNA polymerase sigma factor [unclassified Tamlana]MDO6761687.1 sigma-70 family RNA polymerase sigma factor [Tamlana sp. 2_MG-2023]MDO6792241.1 sigma-70 family RNA polymerase sigma factor [Tamlana sp. 1_MG-2023]
MKCDIYTIWETYQKDLKAYVQKRVSNTEDANDIVQSVLIKVTNYCTHKNNVTHIKAWLYKITQNTIIDYYKKSNQTTSKVSFESLDLLNHQAYDENIFVWLHNFMNRLPKKYALPLYLSDIKELPQKEVAAQLGLTLTATKSRIQRARKMLKEKFEECGKIEASEHQLLSYHITKTCCLK